MLLIAFCLSTSICCVAHAGEPLVLPVVDQNRAPEAGVRFAVTAPEYCETNVHHTVYLPADWESDWKERGMSWPVIVEYTGNFFPQSGSTGKVADAGLGYGISGGRFIWVVLPFVSEDKQTNEITWWGDTQATVEYAKTNVPRICEQFGGKSDAVFICGFSRGAIAVNYIGLHDAEIAKLWCGFISHDHYDGQRQWRTDWGSPLVEYRQRAARRLARIGDRPVLICQNGSTAAVRGYLEESAENISLEHFTFLDVNIPAIFDRFPNDLAVAPHTDRWLLKASPDRQRLWDWVDKVVAGGNDRVDNIE